MKIRISATLDRETEELLDKILSKRKHRNKSHIIEDAIKSYWGESNDARKK